MNSSLIKKKQAQNQKVRLSVPAFLLRTYEMIENPNYQDIICWNKDGASFVIKNINEFSDKVLSNYFKHKNFASFVRQLNMYDFHKIRNENNETEFRHKLFLKGNKQLLIDIKRKSGENQPDDQQDSMQMSSIDVVEMDHLKKEYNLFLQEVVRIKQKNVEFERIIHQLAASMEKNYQENKAHELEFQKFKEEQNEKTDKLFYILCFYMTNHETPDGDSTALSSLSKKMQNENMNNMGNINLMNSFSNLQSNNNNNSNNNTNISSTNIPNQKSKSEISFSEQYPSLNLGGSNLLPNNKAQDFFMQSQSLLSQSQQQQQQQSQQQIITQNNQNLNSSYHSLGENDSAHSQSNNNKNNNQNNSNGAGIQTEHRISKKQDWAAVQQVQKDGDNIPLCPLPFVQRKKEKSQMNLKKTQNLVETFKKYDLARIQQPDIISNVLKQILQGKQVTVSEDAVNQYALGNQAKRMFNQNAMNQGRQNLSLFENSQFKKFCNNNGQSQLQLQGNLGNTNSSNSNPLSLQLGITDGLESTVDLKNLGLYQSIKSNAANQSAPGIFSPSYFNGGDASPRLGFDLYPSPNPDSGQQGQGGNNGGFSASQNIQQGLQTFLRTPSPNMSPMLLRDMEDFISQQSLGNYALGGFGQGNNNHGQNQEGNNESGIVNNIENNRRLSNDLLRSFKVEHKEDRKNFNF